MKNKQMRLLVVQLNGTDVNPYYKFNISQNPFPQIVEAKYSAGCLQVQSLGGDPIPHARAEQYIREKLAGFTDEFVELCIARFRPGAYVEFQVSFPE